MRTILYEEHVACGAKTAPFGGWDMPIQYAGILIEHAYTRGQCSLFDICHMGEFEVAGPTACADLEHLLTQQVASLEVGQCRYGYLLREDGGALDDLTCYRLGPDRYYLVVNAATCPGDAAWIRAHLSPETTFIDHSPQTAKLDIQGPQSRAVLEMFLGEPAPELKYFRAVETTLRGVPGLISRTGYTGEWGYELYFPVEKAVEFWRRFLEHTPAKPAGLGARDTLRLEMGYALYGHELSTDRTPVGAGRGMFIDTTKDFIGKEAVMRELEEGAAQYLVGLQLHTRRAARAGNVVVADDQPVGMVTSGSLAPSIGTAVAMAYVDAPYTTPGASLAVIVGGKNLPATVVAFPFYKDGTARKKSGR
ncbi:MAG: glycine cleavage system aminomethyltransferase GcvT [Spartobacteria bacterium]|nr:glycine cleavage system aminomethyltransferase GcvT [Spartobacteria bacterium]